MSLEAIILGCGLVTLEQAQHIKRNWQQFDNRAVACAVIRTKPPKVELKTLEQAGAEASKTKAQ